METPGDSPQRAGTHTRPHKYGRLHVSRPVLEFLMLDPTLIARDLKVFADPASNFVVQNNTTTLRVQLIRDGNQRDYTIDLVSGRIRSRHRDELSYVDMPSLLASDEFAAIRVFRATQRRILEAKETGKYIDPE